jgi:hypothetical protein
MGFQESATPKASIPFIIDGGGAAITTGLKGCVTAPCDCIITSAELEADTTGSIKIDIWKDVYGNYPPTDTDTICGGNEPEITSSDKYKDTTLTDWTTAISEGDIIAFNVDSCSTITRVTINLMIEKL